MPFPSLLDDSVKMQVSALKPFEVQAIRVMTEGILTEDQLLSVLSAGAISSCEYTGSGYFLSVRHPCLQGLARTCSDPAVVGSAGAVRAGFVVFLSEGMLTLECHTWGAIDVPENFRDMDVVISSSAVNVVELKESR